MGWHLGFGQHGIEMAMVKLHESVDANPLAFSEEVARRDDLDYFDTDDLVLFAVIVRKDYPVIRERLFYCIVSPEKKPFERRFQARKRFEIREQWRSAQNEDPTIIILLILINFLLDRPATVKILAKGRKILDQ